MNGHNPASGLIIAVAAALMVFATGAWLDAFLLANSPWKAQWLSGVAAILFLAAWVYWSPVAETRQPRGRSEQDVHNLLEVTPEAVLLIDKEARVALANAMTGRLFGYDLEQLRGKPVRELLPGYVREAASVAERNASPSPSSDWRIRPHSALVGRRRDGSEFPTEISLSRLDVGAASYLVCFVRDVSERKRMEEQARQSQKLEAVGRLAAGVAHDFNNVLTAVVGFSELLLDRAAGDEVLSEGLQEIHKAGERGVALTRQLLAFGRKQVLAPMAVDVNHLVADMQKMLRRLIREDVQLVTDLANDLHTVLVDPDQLTQIIVNLVVNARDAVPKGGRITLRTRNANPSVEAFRDHPELRGRTYCLLEVSDDGVGMDENTKAHLFEPFYTTKGTGKGTGLGLATVYGIVQQSAGHLEVESALGKGTTFRIYLPQHDAAPEPSAPRTPPPLGGQAPRRTETILLAEDEPSVRTLARRILEQAGYNVLEACDGNEAFRVCAEHPGRIDLLVSDVIMPGMDGRQLAQYVAEARPDCQIVFLTGYADASSSCGGNMELAGINHLLIRKPFTPERLLATIRDVLEGRELAVR